MADPIIEELAEIKREWDRLTKPSFSSKEYKAIQDHIVELTEKVKQLRALLKECKNIIVHDCWQEAQFPDGQIVQRQNLLTNINAALGGVKSDE